MWVYCTDIIYIYISHLQTPICTENQPFLEESIFPTHGRGVMEGWYPLLSPLKWLVWKKNEFPKISVISHWMMAVSALTGSLPSKKIHVAMIFHESQELPWPPGPLWTTNPPGSSLLPLALEAPQKNMGNTHQLWDRKTERTSCSPVFVAEFICLR